MSEPIPLLTVEEACRHLRVGRSTLYRLVAARQLRLTKVGGRTRLRVSELERFVDRHTREKR